MCELVALLQLRTLGGVSLAVTNTEVLSHEGAVTIREVTPVDLLWGVVQLMAVQMFGTGIALPAALKGAFKLPIRLDLAGALPLARSTVDCGLEGVVVHGDF